MGFWFQYVLEFDDEGLTLGVYKGGSKTLRYRLVPSSGGKIEYALETPRDQGDEALSISLLGEGNLHIKSSRPTFIELCVWRRGRQMDPKARSEASKQAFEAWQAAMQSVAAAWERKQAPNEETPR
jgi:hypothetical protein